MFFYACRISQNAPLPIRSAPSTSHTTSGAITVLASSMDVSVSAVPVAGLVGLGVGIDYALFVVARGATSIPRAGRHSAPNRCRRIP